MSDENNVYYDNGSSQNDQSNGYGIASMVCGILALILCCLWFLCVPLAVVSIVLGILQIRKGQKKGMAIAGIVCSAVGIVFLIGLTIYGNFLISSGIYQNMLNEMGIQNNL